MNTLDLLKQLIKIDSSTIDGANDAIEFASRYLYDNGVENKVLINNGYKSLVALSGEGDKTIVINGHLDVVSAGDEDFNPYEKGGKLFGRGSADMKAGCAVLMNLMTKLINNPPGCRVMLQLVSDEEEGGFNCSKHLVEEGYTGDFVICAEPTNLNLGLQSKGFIRLDVVSKGIPAHGSRPWEGENAIIKNMDNLAKIRELDILNEGSNFYDKSSVNLSFLKGGDIYNRVPDSSLMGLDIRYVPGLNPERIVEEIDRIVDGQVALRALGAAVNTSIDNEYIVKFLSCAKEVVGECNIIAQHGSADTRFFANLGIPTIEFGVKGGNWHGENEYIEVESMYSLEETLESFVYSIS